MIFGVVSEKILLDFLNVGHDAQALMFLNNLNEPVLVLL